MSAQNDNKIIAHYVDGSLVKGTTLDFFPSKERFHIVEPGGQVREVVVGSLKALFFVRDFEGDPGYQDRKGFFTSHTQGKKVMVEFSDGEVLFGYTLSYSTRGLGFFMFPGDPDSNNIKVFIVHAATKRVKVKAAPNAYTRSGFSS